MAALENRPTHFFIFKYSNFLYLNIFLIRKQINLNSLKSRAFKNKGNMTINV